MKFKSLEHERIFTNDRWFNHRKKTIKREFGQEAYEDMTIDQMVEASLDINFFSNKGPGRTRDE